MSFATFKQQLAADKKKTAVMGVLLLVLVVVIARLFGSNGPPDAEAEALIPVAAAPAPAPDPTLVRPTPLPVMPPAGASVSAPGGTNVPGIGSGYWTSGKTVAVDTMPRDLARDPFDTTAWDKFKRANSPQGAATAEGKSKKRPKTTSIMDQIRKQFAEYQQVKQAESEKFSTELSSLELQSTMTGTRRSAYISGRLVHEGDMIDGFTVVQILDREVRLSKSGVNGKVRMK